ncbi:isopenicillin N synthase family dioxygenase [Roseicella frigidaeris]|uniref:2-oxoglutarate-dependent ethylene/succinate-forming enzyme n=1 Tax=Roseicella frigidaeris TaxID=2230885 RepID=A0A327M1H5_9PROT|nr:2-oxoglutarate and iron-dependent oxygenase domain-containing protein [Roseicella frigidaeris]RAI57111.1 isopenicillin N synthase family oxygenase [Roseicella frigidaeris]
MASLPRLDLRRLTTDRAAFLAALRAAARDPGFFYLTGHGVDPALEANVVREAHRFFALPEAEKLAVQMVHSPHFRGYNRAGAELTRGRPDWREQFDVHAERPPLPPRPGAPAWTRLQGPNLWPAAQPSLRPALLAWQTALTDLGLGLLRAFAEALEQPADAFEPLHGDAPGQNLKIIRYPALARDAEEQGVGPHKDSGLLSFVLQDAVGGLQVETRDGWVDAPPIPGTFVVNIGELLELASDGYLRATVHRVLSPRGADRLSVAFFLGARLEATVPVLALPPHLAREAEGPEADPANPLLRSVGENILKGRLRSHPDVAERHYTDLLAETAR